MFSTLEMFRHILNAMIGRIGNKHHEEGKEIGKKQCVEPRKLDWKVLMKIGRMKNEETYRFNNDYNY